jgi:uncharacterized membrane protein
VLCLASARPTLAGILIGLGTGLKLYPVLLLPIGAAWFHARGEGRAVRWLLAGFAAAVALAFLPVAARSGADTLSFIAYHSRRGVEIESLVGGALMFGRVAGLWAAHPAQNFGAVHVDATAAGATAAVSLAVLFLGYAGLLVVALRRFRRDHGTDRPDAPRALVTAVVCALLGFMVLGKVFSPQYLAWLLPFVPSLRARAVVWCGVLFALTAVLFPAAYPGLVRAELLPVLLVNARNATALVIIVGAFRFLIHDRPASAPAVALPWGRRHP